MLRVLVDMNKEVVGNERHPTHMNQAGESPAPKIFLPENSTSSGEDQHLKRKAKAPYVDPHAHPDADEFGHIPLPANYQALAADSSRNYGAEEDARARERGEEPQELDGIRSENNESE
jgi:hypothetical protein